MEYKKALNLAAALCSKKEYCRDDIRKKLLAWEISPEDCDRMLDFLQKNRFIDEARFASFYARDKFRFNRWGVQKISLMLRQKGIPSDIVREALATLDSSEYEATCMALLKQKCRTLRDADALKAKARLFRFCLGRGFDYETIQKCYDLLKKDTTGPDFCI